jgi:hypothetical protein
LRPFVVEKEAAGCDKAFVHAGPGSYQSWRVIAKLVILLAFARAFPAQGLTITPTFDSSITGDPNAATIIATINSVIALYEANFSDPITVTITFQETGSGLGASSSFFVSRTYSNFRSHLASDATTFDDSVALAHLPGGTVNPVNGNTDVNLTTANARAIGFSANPPAGENDGTILLNTSIMNLDRTSIDFSKYDLFAVAAHEIDEVLGFGSALNGLSNGDPTPTGAVWTMDLFRYDQNGSRSFDTALSTQAYFSIDSTNLLVRFNQDAGGDFSDWFSSGAHTPRVQDAFATPGATPNPGIELIGLDVLGYNLVQPKLTIVRATTGHATISWAPAAPNYVLQETTNLTSLSWVDSASGSANPATVATLGTVKFYRLRHL